MITFHGTGAADSASGARGSGAVCDLDCGGTEDLGAAQASDPHPITVPELEAYRHLHRGDPEFLHEGNPRFPHEPAQIPCHPLGGGHVQVGRELVQEEEIRPLRQEEGEPEPLPLPGGGLL